MPGLFLIPNVISSENEDRQLPPYISELIQKIDVFIVENVRNARRFMKRVYNQKNIDEVIFFELNKHTDLNRISDFLDPAFQDGKDIGLISEAGIPCVADPGSIIVSLAHEKKLEVVPVVGPSSLLLTLMESGFNGQLFSFNGYLPIDKNERKNKIREIERRAVQEKSAQIFIETPYRNNQLFDDILSVCNNNTKLCVGVELLHDNGYVKTKKIIQWQQKKPDLHKKMVVFIIGGY